MFYFLLMWIFLRATKKTFHGSRGLNGKRSRIGGHGYQKWYRRGSRGKGKGAHK